MNKILVVMHIYYPEMWSELKDCLKNITEFYDLYVTTIDANKYIKQDILNFNSKAHFEIVENRGFDVGPFIHVLNKVNLDNYKYIIKLHTKRNLEYGQIGFRKLDGNKWREKLLSFIKTPESFEKSLRYLSENKKVGMLSSVNTIVEYDIYDKKASINTKRWLKEHNLPSKHYSFVAGTMFIARASIFKNIQKLKVSIQDFPEANGEHVFQLAHVFERLFGYYTAKDGYFVRDPNLSVSEQRKIQKQYLSKNRWKQIKRFVFQSKISKKGKQIVKICKIPLPMKLLSKIVRIKKKDGKKKIFLCGIHIFSININSINVFDYSDWLDELHNNKAMFIPLTSNKYKRKARDTKVFAFYLTQFHSIPENDLAYGKGFTEWTNVASCRPFYIGHYQPKIPYDVGFYNLLQPGIMERQCELAKIYGIYGFCFYYYWFSGKKALEKPLEYFLKSNIDFHFHLCWANENWSKLWDGGNKEIIFEQKLLDDDAEKFFYDLLPYIMDRRYEKINNRPILMIYRPSLFDKDKFISFVDKLNQLAIKEGFDGFYLMASNMNDFKDPKSWNMEGIIEFPPHGLNKYCPPVVVDKISKTASFSVLDIKPYIKEKIYLEKREYPVFKGCFPSWDNLPRKAFSVGTSFKIDPSDFEEWLSDIIRYTKKNNKSNEQYVYINAWNEWAEGAILEPTTRYGYKYLSIVKKCIERSRVEEKNEIV